MMNEKVDLFFEAMCFTPIWGLVALLLIVHFFFSWYHSARKTGWKIDFWHLTLFFGIFQSTLIVYPFSASPYNMINTMGQMDRIAPFIDRAFAISILGYCSIWLGRYCFDLTQGKFAFIALAQFLQPLSRAIESNVKSKRAITLVTFLTIILGLSILSIQFLHGYFFNGREFFLKSPYLRPFFNIAISIFPVVLSFLALRFTQFKEKRALLFFFSLLGISMFFGARFIFLNGLLFLFIQQVFYRDGAVSLFKTAVFCTLLMFLAVLMGNLRHGNYNLFSVIGSMFFSFFYGNNFSDIRDFAWILSYWDGEYLYGKSFFAALISFIPRVFSSIREEWSFSMYTNGLLGFDSEVMPGLRPGLFGEPYLNFGLLGVVFFGGLFGFSLRFADCKLKEAVKASRDIIKGYSQTAVYFAVQCFIISAGMWMFYIFVLINIAMIPLRERTKKHCQKV